MDKRVKDLETIKEVFDKYGVRFFVVYGALLGMHRDGKLIEHDDDIDLAVVDPVPLATRKEIGATLGDLGFRFQPIAFNVFGRMELTAMGGAGECRYDGDEETGIIVCERDFKFTLFFFKEEECEKHGKEYVCTPKKYANKLISTPAKFYQKADTIKINGKKYLAPSPIAKYLEYSYINWKDKNGRDHSPTYPEAHL
jgi:hypothetical protein